MEPWTKPVALEGKLVKLIPLDLSHQNDLLNAASDGNLWELWFTSVPSAATISKYLNSAFENQQKGLALPFTIIDKKTNKIVGSTRYLNIEAENRRLEIGATWYAKSVQRTGINTECKYLLLQHAFETLGCIAVEFRTHYHNLASRNAILRLGAKQEGILRNHRIDPQGNYRDTVVFSILDNEWKTVKASLEYRMNKSY
ncbi:GNAT family N-acetyltransferase [Muricauda sp. 2012CJ35-5]|uniref:GNAT family N-acetyltransferase n=1 Tax=Flagellimonas spongiicola TaxID=2942208 RepID=A0ABT0PTM5_9FLAO|nr:GNAT family protein [Allomuricauda spongiicola]MCL6274566.1 GNAT family N-acetyltransferase [Allomuricauda spongiicola]